MKEIKLHNNTYLFVEVPFDATDFYYDSWFTRYVNHSKGSIKFDVNTEIISTTKDITEEQAESIVEKILGFGTKNQYKDYKLDVNFSIYFTPKESLQSLIQANGLDINKNYLILKKI
jgi:hypothetical protein